MTEANNIASSVLPTTTIPTTEYKMLQFGAKLLAALKQEGVDAWEGFERAVAAIEADVKPVMDEVVSDYEAAVVE